MLRYSYNTNGFAHHRLEDAISIIRDLGYAGIGITLDVHHINPFEVRTRELDRWRKLLNGLEVVIQTGARFLLDPRRKHEPTLLTNEPEGRALRVAFLERAIEIGAELGATSVSFWSGAAPAGVAEAELQNRLADGCSRICEKAGAAGISLAFEPEPGMWIERVDQYQQIRDRVARPELGLALDVGHLAVTGEDLDAVLLNYSSELRIVQIEDIRDRVHNHLMFGEGELDFVRILGAFEKYQYRGLLECELSRDSHRAPTCAAEAIRFLQKAETAARSQKKEK
ncbi:MAG: sugar phosphate isomerase/epimerase family protein [Planctomycetota bacterium]